MRNFRSRTLLLLFVAALVASATSFAQDTEPADDDRHRVKGEIEFSYDYAATLAAAKENGKPILAYFTFEK